MGDSRYTVQQVAALLLYSPECFMSAHDPPAASMQFQGTKAGRERCTCQKGPPDHELACSVNEQRRHNAEQLAKPGLSWREREDLAIALADLELAFHRLSGRQQKGIARFCFHGPQYLDSKRVEFQPFQSRYVLSLWREVNGT